MSSPRFGLPHLSEDAVAAFADGVLSASAAGRARRHCAECAECAAAVRIQQETAMLLRTAPAPALPSGLLDRLAGLPMSTPLPAPRGGLPTVLGADGTPVFVAHDVHRALAAAGKYPGGGQLAGGQLAGGHPGGERPTGEQPAGEHAAGEHLSATGLDDNPTAGRPAHRRGTLPVTMLASAAAVVAAGTFGGHVSSLAATSQRPTPAGAAQVAGALTGNRPAGPSSPSAGQSSMPGAPGALTGAGPVLDTGHQAGAASGAGADTNATRPAARPAVPLPPSVTVARVHRQPGALSVLPAVLAGYRPTTAGAPAATP